MKKVIRLTESDLHKMIKNSINEISYGAVADAQDVGYDTFSDLWHNFWRFDSSLEELENTFKDEVEPSLYQNSNFNALNTSGNNPYMNKIYSLMLKIEKNLSELRVASDEINGILERKKNKNDSFEDSIMKFDKEHNDDDISWDDYRKKEINGGKNY
jgi:hypothetical protein